MINILPKDWKLLELSDICHNNGEYGSSAKAADFDADLPRYLRISDIDENGNLNENKVSPSLIEEKYFLKEGDLLFARSGATVGKTYLYNELDGLCQYAGYLIRFEPNFGIINPNYLFYYVKSPYYWKWIDSNKKTMTLPNINAKRYSKMTVPVPPLETQKKIVEIIEKAEKLKEWRAEADELADEYLKSVFLEMFGHLGNNSKNWPIDNLGNCAPNKGDFVDGPFGSNLKVSDQTEKGVRLIQINNIGIGDFRNFNKKFTSEKKYEELIRHEAKVGDIVIAKMGDPLCRSCILPDFIDKSLVVADCMRLRITNMDYNPFYVVFFLNSIFAKEQLKSLSHGSTRVRVNLTMIKKLKIPKPPITLQNQFAQIVQQLEKLKTHQSQSKQEIDNLFNTIMQKAFKGELIC